jgi:TfoX/Sxy family transcriptional regulator of competence genes
MSTTQEYIEYVLEQIDNSWNKRYRKMFGEYMVYINDKPVLLVCDNTVFVKKLECVNALLSQVNTCIPYNGAKEHYILDIDNSVLVNMVIQKLESEIPIPVKKTKRKD